MTGEFPAQMAINAENASIWWRHLVKKLNGLCYAGRRYVFFIVGLVKRWDSEKYYLLRISNKVSDLLAAMSIGEQ